MTTQTMKFLELQIGKLRGRIKQIEDNPNPSKLRSNKLMYENELEFRLEQLDGMKQGRPFAAGHGMPPSLCRAMGFHYVDLHTISDQVGDVSTYMRQIRNENYPDTACDRTVLSIMMCLSGDIPAPAFVGATNFTCDPLFLQQVAVGASSKCPTYCIDVPDTHEPGEWEIRYITHQIEEMIEYAQETVPGIHYDRDKHQELMELDAHAQKCVKDIYELRKRHPCPISGQDVFRLGRQPSMCPNPKKQLEYWRAYRDEVQERAETGVGVISDEKLRLMWAISGPYGGDFFKKIEDRGVSVVHFATGGVSAPVRPGYGDVTQFGRKLSLLEEMARVLSYNSWGGLGKRWVSDVVMMSRLLSCDAIVLFEQWGCVATAGLRKLLADRAEQELGILTLSLEGRNIGVHESERAEMDVKLYNFLDMCLARKSATGVAS